MKKPHHPPEPSPRPDSPAEPRTKKPGMSPQKKASLYWLIGLLVVAMAVFVYVTPPSHRIRVVVAFALVAPWAIGTFLYVMRKE